MPQSSRHPVVQVLGRLALTAAMASAVAAPASAIVLTATQLNVYRDGTSAEWLLGNRLFLGDSFDNGNPLVGPNFLMSNGLPSDRRCPDRC